MKSFLISLLFILSIAINVQAQEDAIVRYFNQYVDNDDFTSVFISPKMFQMMAKLDINDPDYQSVKQVFKDIKGLRILTTEKDPQKFYNEALSKINTKEYELLMTVKDKDENVRFLTKEAPNGTISELLLISGDKDEFVLLSFTGTINLDEISKLSNKLDVKGMDELKNLDKKQ